MRKLLAVFVLLCSAAFAQVTVTNKGTFTVSNGTSATTGTETLTAGSTLIVVAGQTINGTTLVPSTAQGDTFSACASNGTYDSTSGTAVWLWFVPSVIGGTNASEVTISAASSVYMGGSAYQVTGLSATPSCDQIALATGTSASVSSGATPTLIGNDLVIASLSNNRLTAETYTVGTGFTAGQNVTSSNSYHSYMEWQSSSASTAACTAGLSASVAWNAYCVALKVVATAVAPTFSPAAGTYLQGQAINITSTTGGALICYTVDGSTPTANSGGTACTHGTQLANGGGFQPTYGTFTLKAIAANSIGSSSVVSGSYTITQILMVDRSKWLVLNGANEVSWCARSGSVIETSGLLTETATYTSSYCPGTGGATTPYNVGVIMSRFSFTYGKVLVRAKMAGLGVHTGIWMLGGASNSLGYPPTCLATIAANTSYYINNCTSGSSVPTYEIDFAEFKPSQSGNNSTIWNNSSTWVNGVASGSGVGSFAVNTGMDLTAAFHVYEFDWTPTTFTFKVDGTVTTTGGAVVSVPMFLILDQEMDAMGGMEASSYYPLSTQFTYVRVCSSVSATCNVGDPTMEFDDEFTGAPPSYVPNSFIQ